MQKYPSSLETAADFLIYDAVRGLGWHENRPHIWKEGMQAFKDQGLSTVADIKGVPSGQLDNIPVTVE